MGLNKHIYLFLFIHLYNSYIAHYSRINMLKYTKYICISRKGNGALQRNIYLISRIAQEDIGF